jgi:hypothetical protein
MNGLRLVPVLLWCRYCILSTKGEWNQCNINAFNVLFDSTASTPFTWIHTPVAERKNSDKRKKSQADLRVVTAIMQLVEKIITDQVRCPIWDLSESCSLRLLSTWPILILVSLGWSEAKNYQQRGSWSCR